MYNDYREPPSDDCLAAPCSIFDTRNWNQVKTAPCSTEQLTFEPSRYNKFASHITNNTVFVYIRNAASNSILQ